MFKKIAIVVLFLGAAAGMAYLLYRFFFASTPPVATPPDNGGITTPGGGLPTANEGRPTTGGEPTASGGLPTQGASTVSNVAAGGPTSTPSVSESRVMSPTAAGGLKYYDAFEGKFYQVLPDGTKATLSPKAFPSASAVTWSLAGDKALITFPDDSKIIYDFAAQKQVTIPSHWEDATFSADGSMIVAKSIGLDPANRWLVSAASDGTGAKLIEPLGLNGDKVTVSVSPDASVVAFSDTSDPVGFDTRDLLVIGQNRENFPALRVEGFDFRPQWSPDGSRLLYSVAGQASAYAPSLWIVNGSEDQVGAGRTSLGIRTWADKCTFQDAGTLYCAVPQSLPEGAGLQPDIADTIPDNVYKVDLASGSATLVGTPADATSMRSLTISADGAKLYFVAADGTLKEMRLR